MDISDGTTGRNRLSRRGFITRGVLAGLGLAGAALVGCSDEGTPTATAEDETPAGLRTDLEGREPGQFAHSPVQSFSFERLVEVPGTFDPDGGCKAALTSHINQYVSATPGSDEEALKLRAIALVDLLDEERCKVFATLTNFVGSRRPHTAIGPQSSTNQRIGDYSGNGFSRLDLGSYDPAWVVGSTTVTEPGLVIYERQYDGPDPVEEDLMITWGYPIVEQDLDEAYSDRATQRAGSWIRFTNPPGEHPSLRLRRQAYYAPHD